MRRASLFFAIASLIAMACVGDDPEPGATGTIGAACYPNGTCNPGLVCGADVRCAPGGPGNGDGGVDARGGADGGTDTGGVDPATKRACNGDVNCPRVVFVTSGEFPGALSNVTGADGKCNTAATAAGTHPAVHNRTFVAWLSTTSKTAAGTLAHSALPYTLPTGELVAISWDALTSSNPLNHAIDVDENGKKLTGAPVWTGTARDGTATNLHCNNWFDAASNGRGTTGRSGETSEKWTQVDQAGAACNVPAHLYCIEL
jgi:hypothetical protein